MLKFQCKCRMCNKEAHFRTDTLGSCDISINEAAVIGVIAGGGGYAGLNEFAAAVNMQCMSNQTYIQCEQEVGVAIEDACLESMLEAGAEAKRIAILAGDVDREGIPLLTVLADGIWGKRSYKVKYDSLSGTVSFGLTLTVSF